MDASGNHYPTHLGLWAGLAHEAKEYHKAENRCFVWALVIASDWRATDDVQLCLFATSLMGSAVNR